MHYQYDNKGRVFNLDETLYNISFRINKLYPFNIILHKNPEKPINGFIVTMTKSVYKKHGVQIMYEIFKYFKEELNMKAALILERKKKPFFKKDMFLYYSIKIN